MRLTLVTGGTGLIGTNLLRTLAANGEKVRLLSRRSSNKEGLKGLDVEEFYGDVRDYTSVRRAMEGVEKVYHVAARVNLSPFQREEMFQVNVKGTENVCRAALDAKVRRVVHTSTVSTVGKGSKDKPADENTFYDYYSVDCPYWASKLLGELVVLNYVKNHNLDAVIVNPGYVLGPWDIKPSSGAIILWAVATGGLMFYPKGSLNVVDVRDVVAGEIAAMEKGRTGQRYLLGNENLSQKEFLIKIATTLNLRKPRIPLCDIFSYPFAAVGDLGGQFFPRIFEKWNTLLVTLMKLEQYIDVSKARNELNLPATPICESIKSAFDWFKKSGRL